MSGSRAHRRRGRHAIRFFRIFPVTLVLVLLSTFALIAQTPGPRIVGARFFEEDYVRSLVRGRSPDSARVAIHAAYNAAGFLNAAVAVDSVTVTIEEGERFHVGRVAVIPDSVTKLLPDDSGLDALPGEPFSAVGIDDLLQSIVGRLNDAGYPLAVARVAGFEIVDSAARVDLTLSIAPGDRVIVREIDLRGNTETSRNLIVTAAAIPPDAPFTDELARQVRARLVRLNVFADVAEPQLYRNDSGAYGMLITVTEGNANTFDGVVGYQPPEGLEEDGSLTGLLNVVLRNLFGVGLRFSARWQSTKDARDLEFRGGQPFVLGLPIDVEIGYRQRQEAAVTFLPSYVQRYLTGDLYYGFTDAWWLRLGGAFEETIPEADTLRPCSEQLFNSRTLQSTIGVQYDSRSNPINPLSGVRYVTSFSLGSKAIRGTGNCPDTLVAGSESRRRIEADFEAYGSLTERIVGVAAIHGGEIQGDYLEESDLFRFGGQSTVRGYREDQFRASRRAWGTAEVRLILARSSFASVFFDGGYYLRPEDTLRGIAAIEEWIYGYGIGGQIETPLGLVRLSFSFGKGDTFETGKIFVGLVNQF